MVSFFIESTRVKAGEVIDYVVKSIFLFSEYQFAELLSSTATAASCPASKQPIIGGRAKVRRSHYMTEHTATNCNYVIAAYV
jgi:hypothetical protein